MASSANSPSDARVRLSRTKMAIFGFPSLPHAFIVLPLTIVIPTYYAQHTGVTLAAIAAFTTLTRLADAIIDPLVGFMSDRTRSPLGARKPYVLAATVLSAISIFFLFQPPPDASAVYYGLWSFLLYLGFTLFEIPRNAWATELSRDYFVRARIMGWVSIFSIAGGLVFWTVPIALSYFTGSTALDGNSLTVIAWLYAILMPAGVILAIALIPSGPATADQTPTLARFFRSLRTNALLWRYLAIVACWGLGQGAYLSVILIFLSDYMQAAQIFPFIMIAFFVIQILAMPIWLKIIGRIGKHRTWAVSMTLDVLTRPLILLFEPGSTAIFPLLALASLGAFLNTPSNLTPNAILGDVVDYDIMKGKANNAGNFFALNVLAIKATMALGAGLSFLVLDRVGYQVGAVNSPDANTGLIVVYLVFPAVMYLAASVFSWTFPLDARRHGIIRRRLERASPQVAA